VHRERHCDWAVVASGEGQRRLIGAGCEVAFGAHFHRADRAGVDPLRERLERRRLVETPAKMHLNRSTTNTTEIVLRYARDACLLAN
jgi:hypothetical protein